MSTNEKNPIVNIDYVVTVIKDNGRLALHSYDTNVPHDTIGRMKEMCEDDTYSIVALQDEMASKLPGEVPAFIDYLAPIGCQQAYVSASQYPANMSAADYDAALTQAEADAEKLLEQQLQVSYPNEPEFRTRKFNERVGDVRTQARHNKAFQLKRNYYCCARRYLYAWYYQNAIKVNQIRERLTNDIKMYSTDTIGFTHFRYPVSNDVEIKVHTNFGYGVASYFRLELAYKGIPILPYSFYVNYYYANSRELARYTRLYEPERENWEKAFNFVVVTANLASADPVRFIREWVMNEVTTMVAKLKKIMEDPALYMGKWLEKMDDTNTESPYLHVRKMDYEAAQEYKCYPFEMSIDFKSKKISGALDFLESLEALKPIYGDVDKDISEIRILGQAILPEMRKALETIKFDINKLATLRSAWQRRRENLTKRLSAFDAECKTYVGTQLAAVDHKKWTQQDLRRFEAGVVDDYEKAHPAYSLHKQAVNWCMNVEAKLDTDIAHRTKFKESIEACEDKILIAGL